MIRKWFAVILMACLVAAWLPSMAFASVENTQKMDERYRARKGSMISPVGEPMIVTSPQGWRIHPILGTEKYHSGTDLGVDYGAPIYAAQSGTVTTAGWLGGYGYAVIIDHGGGLTTLYGHNQLLLVSSGQYVKQGEQIAEAGSTGLSSGPHCHFEVRVNDIPVDPGLYVPGLLELEIAQGGGRGGGKAPQDTVGKTYADWEVAQDFAKPIRDVIEQLTAVVTKALGLIREYIAKIFFVLVSIDLALGGMKKAMTSTEEDRGGLFPWMVRRVLFYALCLVLLFGWGDFVGNLSLYGFPELGTLVGGDASRAQAAVSDPTLIVQKGMSITATVINEAMKIHGIFDLVFHGATSIFCLIFGVVLFVLFCIIGYQIAMAYLEFYLTILFSFTSFSFAGLSHVRRYASNGLNGVFAVSLNLMFFCVFAIMLQTTLENLVVTDLVSTQSATTMAGPVHEIKSMPELMQRIRMVESGGDYDVDNGIAHGAYQVNYSVDNWNRWCQMYQEASPSIPLDTYADASPRANEPAGSEYPWTIKNQDLIAEFILSGYVAEYGSYEAAARAWHRGTGAMDDSLGYAYLAKVLGTTIAPSVQTVANVGLLLQITLIVLMYMFFADRMQKLILTQFGQSGFRLAKE